MSPAGNTTVRQLPGAKKIYISGMPPRERKWLRGNVNNLKLGFFLELKKKINNCYFRKFLIPGSKTLICHRCLYINKFPANGDFLSSVKA